jgi:hypothetical protein
MKKTQKEIDEHQHRTMLIANQMGKEYGDWFGFPGTLACRPSSGYR